VRNGRVAETEPGTDTDAVAAARHDPCGHVALRHDPASHASRTRRTLLRRTATIRLRP
jgi:hypothetical protein